MANELVWVEPDGVIRLNKRLVDRTDEPHLLLSAELLESACAKPQNHWAYGERDVAVLATELLFGLARNHPFAQGNKRTAYTSMLVFLAHNGFRLTMGDDVGFADLIIEILEHRASQVEVVEKLRAALRSDAPGVIG